MDQDRVSHATPSRVVPSLMSSDSSPRVRPARASGWESLRTLVGGFYSKFCSTYFCTNSSSQRTFGQRHGKFSSSANGDFIDILDRSLSATPRDDIKVYVMSPKSHSRVNVAGRMSSIICYKAICASSQWQVMAETLPKSAWRVRKTWTYAVISV